MNYDDFYQLYLQTVEFIDRNTARDYYQAYKILDSYRSDSLNNSEFFMFLHDNMGLAYYYTFRMKTALQHNLPSELLLAKAVHHLQLYCKFEKNNNFFKNDPDLNDSTKVVGARLYVLGEALWALYHCSKQVNFDFLYMARSAFDTSMEYNRGLFNEVQPRLNTLLNSDFIKCGLDSSKEIEWDVRPKEWNEFWPL